MQATQIQFDGVGKLKYVKRDLPALSPKQVLVKIEACGLCTWERYIFSGVESMPFPFVGGHEIAATVVEKGADVGAHIKVGMGVAVAKWVRCNECEPCRRGLDNHCEGNDGPSQNPYSGPGGFSDYMICESYQVYPFNANAPIQFAALAEPVACVTRGVNKMPLVAGDTVAIVGAGLMGLLFLKILKLKGCKVIMVQRSEKRRNIAAQMGADFVIDPAKAFWVDQVNDITGGVGAAGVVYTAGGGKVLNECLKAARLGAHVVIYAPTHEEQPSIESDLIHFKELVVTGALRHDKESFRQAVKLLGSGQIDFTDLSLVFGDFNDLEGQMKRADEDRDIHRILLRW